jgi:hypothetical protein
MRKRIIRIAVAALLAASAFADQDTILPFKVKLGGQEAVLAETDAVFAVVSQAVAADADIVADTTDEAMRVDIYAADGNGNALPEAAPVSITTRKNTAAKLSQTPDGARLPPGRYIMNLISPTKGTARVFFAVR